MNLVLWIMTMRVKITTDIWCLKVNDIPCGSDGKESVCSAGDLGSISGLGRSFGEGNDYPLQYSSLKNGQRYLVGYSPWGNKGSDRTEHKHGLGD